MPFSWLATRLSSRTSFGGLPPLAGEVASKGSPSSPQRSKRRLAKEAPSDEQGLCSILKQKHNRAAAKAKKMSMKAPSGNKARAESKLQMRRGAPGASTT